MLRDRDRLSETNYVRNASPEVDYRVEFGAGRLQEYIGEHGDDFNLNIAGSESLETDFYVIPYSHLKYMLVEEYLSGERSRWIGTVVHYKLKISNCPFNVDIGEFYGNPRQLD